MKSGLNLRLIAVQAHAYLADWAHTITIEDVNREAASLLAFASFYGNEAEAMQEFRDNPERYSELGPSRATSVVACYPAYTDLSGESIGGPLSTTLVNAFLVPVLSN